MITDDAALTSKEDTVILPQGWRLVNLSEISESIQYGYTESSSEAKVGPKFLRITDIQNSRVLWENVPFCRIDDGLLSKYQLRRGDLVFARTGATVGKSYLIRDEIPNAVFASYLIRVRIKTEADINFIYLFFNSINYWKQINEGRVGIGQPNVNGTKLGQLKVPLPPLRDQHAIVFKIEELFSELDTGIEQLKTAQQQLKTYRQAVLKWAFEGRLTNEDLKDGELPEGWKWVKLDEIATKITDGEHFRPKTQVHGIPFLSAKDIRSEGVSFDDPLFISEETANKAWQRCNPEKGDLLIVSRGATVGRMCIVTTEKKFCLLGSVILIKVKKAISSKYINYVLKSPIANQKMIAVSGATAQQAIYLRDIKNIEIPLCSVEEQHLIVKEIESRLSVCDKLEETINQSLAQAETLRQSILKKAFEGRLIS